MLSDYLHLTLHWVAAHPGWMGLIVFLTALGESLAVVGLILPGAALMLGFGALIALGHLEFWPTWVWATTGAIIGDGLSFWLGHVFHQQLRQIWPFSAHPELLDRAVSFFQRHGAKSVLLGRFVGPLRPVIPAVAGMMDMPLGRYLPVNIISAVLWAPAYLLPGMAFGASLELAAQVTGRLVVVLLLLLALLGCTAWLVRALYRLLQPHVQEWLKRFALWSRRHPLLAPVSASLLDPEKEELRGLATLAALLLGSLVFVSLLLAAAGQRLPTPLDLSLFRFLQSLRTPWADDLMVFITSLGDVPVKLTLTVAVLACLWWQGARSAALHWLAAVGFGLVSSALFKWLTQAPRPVAMYEGVSRFAFPSNHATMTTIQFGFLAVLIAHELPPARRWRPYLAAALLIVPIAFSRLYLGAHWLTDTLGGLSLGVAWVALLGLGYSRHPTQPLRRWSLLTAICITVLVAELWDTALYHHQDLHRYQLRPTLHTESREQWWQTNGRSLRAYRLDWQGNQRQPLELQWAGSRQELERRLHAAGWRTAPALTPASVLFWLNPQVQMADLPVLPRVHEGRHETLALVHSGTTPATRWVLRLWDSELRLEPGAVPVWLGNISLQTVQHRLAFFSLAVELPDKQGPQELLAPALQGLQQKTATAANRGQSLLLVAD